MSTIYIPGKPRQWEYTGPNTYRTVRRYDDVVADTFHVSQFLDSDTISSITYEAHGPLVTNTSNTSTSFTLTISQCGYVDVVVTTAAGQKFTMRLRVDNHTDGIDDYR